MGGSGYKAGEDYNVARMGHGTSKGRFYRNPGRIIYPYPRERRFESNTVLRKWSHHLLSPSSVGNLAGPAFFEDTAYDLPARWNPELLSNVMVYPIYRSVFVVIMYLTNQRSGERMFFGQNDGELTFR